MTPYAEMPDRERDCIVAERFMGWTNIALSDWDHSLPYPLDYGGKPPGERYVHLIPRYSTDDNAARTVRDRIAELGLIAPYRRALARLIWPKGTPMSDFKGADEFAFRFEQATARQQMIAALEALDAAGKE